MITPLIQSPRRSKFVADDCSADSVFGYLSHLEGTYPGFRAWFHDKVISPLSSEERAIFVKWVNERPSGIAIAKRSSEERKLCTLWVDPAARTSGVGADLGARAFEWLGTSKPLFTVPEERIEEFRGLLNRWDFHPRQALVGYYRSKKAEYVFNGQLKPKVSA